MSSLKALGVRRTRIQYPCKNRTYLREELRAPDGRLISGRIVELWRGLGNGAFERNYSVKILQENRTNFAEPGKVEA